MNQKYILPAIVGSLILFVVPSLSLTYASFDRGSYMDIVELDPCKGTATGTGLESFRPPSCGSPSNDVYYGQSSSSIPPSNLGQSPSPLGQQMSMGVNPPSNPGQIFSNNIGQIDYINSNFGFKIKHLSNWNPRELSSGVVFYPLSIPGDFSNAAFVISVFDGTNEAVTEVKSASRNVLIEEQKVTNFAGDPTAIELKYRYTDKNLVPKQVHEVIAENNGKAYSIEYSADDGYYSQHVETADNMARSFGFIP